MGGVHFHRIVTGRHGAPRRPAESGDDGADFLPGQLSRHRVLIAPVQAAGSDDAFARDAALAPGVGELHRQLGARRVHKVHQPLKRLHLCVLPEAQVVPRDAPAPLHGRGLLHDKPYPAHRPRAVVHKMPIGGPAVVPG